MLQLVGGERAGIHVDAAFGAAVGQAHDAALPRHEHGQGAHGVQVQPGLVAQAALGGAAADVVMHAIASEDADPSVVQLDREVHHELALDLPQKEPLVFAETDHVGRGVEAPLGRRECRLRTDFDRHQSLFTMPGRRRARDATDGTTRSRDNRLSKK